MNSSSIMSLNLDSTPSSTIISFRVQGEAGFNNGTNFYSEKYNMIIACPTDNTVQFYNATTLLPVEGRQTLHLDSSVLKVSHSAETNTCLLTCEHGNVYSYHLSKDLLVKQEKSNEILSATANFVNPVYYEFSSSQLSMRNVQDIRITRSSRILRKTTLPQEWRPEGDFIKVENIIINGKEHVIAAEASGVIRIWEFSKGEMRSVKVINAEEKICWFIYLEKHQMIVTSHGKEYVKFWSLASGKLKWTYYSDEIKSKDVFLMNGKNAIGIADSQRNMVEIVPLLLNSTNGSE